MFDTSRPFTFDRVVRILITIATLIGAYWLLKAISGALLPFCVACLLAYIFEPFVAFNKRLLRCRGNVLPIFLFLVELFGVIALLGWFLIPRIIDEIVTVGNLFNDYATSSSSRYIPQAVHDFVMKYVDMKTLASVLTQEQWSDIVQKSLSGTWTMVSGSISMLLTVCSWFIVLLYFIFILLDYDRFMNSMRSLIPQKYKPTVLKIAGDIKNSMNRYFRGQTLVALCVGVLFSIGFLIIDLPLAIIMGMFIGLLNMVPYLHLAAAHHTAVRGLCRRDKFQLLGDFRFGNGGLWCGTADTRPVSRAKNHGKDNGAQPCNHPSVAVNLGIAARIPRLDNRLAAHHTASVILQHLRAARRQTGTIC